jgi:hypothetical protein
MAASSKDPMASASSQVQSDRLRLGEAKQEREGYPYAHKRSENPEQKRGLADRKPWKLRALEEELAAANGNPVWPALDYLGAHRGCRVVRNSTLGVVIDRRSSSVPRRPTRVLSHGRSLPSFTVANAARKDVTT